jgi:hypothetical protein
MNRKTGPKYKPRTRSGHPLQRTGYRTGGRGRLVLHRTRLHPVAPSRVDPSLRLTRTERRRLTRGTARPPEANAPTR